ncbi:hypothetical protein CO110_00040 [Candidatus Desantisbacteria bacterium CG_4_9_14_3_um_filter_40_11]|uniref:Uncharacterized protein n=3 Tax=unclassified Candidatus Desantisiibacteriota TaxID=3106372 RepID=A0A2M7JE75_9BACT|nr:MAG: hypothetical protein COX18_07730 [Candidatus Desantisbacteria bacterium CG23_combo_of_CG06-09_8_20_14_all_40_23]PIX17690.1 MAG: hypothetical protein COZ71_02020 [Candidatus Desantisbacteria bacterium CG_4_8_14_3_um_filter_40_12]PJB30529.1 MAG: hypothetical protein CO110_00040 [Candidatus Desantisbacteria bacterium CG_4_9_14_3_um_filter_40_11]
MTKERIIFINPLFLILITFSFKITNNINWNMHIYRFFIFYKFFFRKKHTIFIISITLSP